MEVRAALPRHVGESGRANDLHRLRGRLYVGADNLATHYSEVADDGACSSAKREAAILFVAAEDALNRGDDPAEAIRTAGASLEAARTAGDEDSLADALRLMLKAQLLHASAARYRSPSEGGGNAADGEAIALKEAERLASTELAHFQAALCRRGMAAMQLSLAELQLLHGGRQRVAAALDYASKASVVFSELEDKKMEAAAMAVLASIHVANGERAEAQKAADIAVAGFRAAADWAGEARSLHWAAASRCMGGACDEYEQGVQLAVQAKDLYRKLGLKRAHASELITVAQLQLEMDSPADAAASAADAREFCRDLGSSAGLEAAAITTLADALMAQGEPTKAAEGMEEALREFKAAGDKRQQAIMNDARAHALLVSDRAEEAVRSAQDAVALCRELHDREWQAFSTLTLCQAYSQQREHDKAVRAAWDAVALLYGAKDVGEAVATAQRMLAAALAVSEDLEIALKAAYKARDLFSESGNQAGEALTLLMCSSAHVAAGQHLDAIAAATAAKDLFDLAGDVRGQGLALRSLGEAHEAGQELDLALAAAEKRRHLLQAAGWRRAEASALRQVAHLRLLRGSAAEAGQAARAGLRLARVYGDKPAEVRLLLEVVQADLALLESPPPTAEVVPPPGAALLGAAEEAVDLAKQLGDAALRAAALYWRAYVQLCAGLPEAAQTVDEALVLLRMLRDAPGEARALVLAAQARSDNKTEACELARKALAIFKQEEDTKSEAVVTSLLDSWEVKRPVAAAAQALAVATEPEEPEALEAPVAAEPQRPRLTEDHVQGWLMNTLKDMVEVEDFDMEQPIMEAGMDSLLSIQFINDLSRHFRVKMPSTAIFDFPSVKALTQYIMEIAEDTVE